MKITDYLIERLVDNGLWENEAETVLEKAKQHETCVGMQGRWSDDVSAYPAFMLSTLLLSVKWIAVEHLQVANPDHFALKLLPSADK